jgi:2-acylglycerol O-acyltransferase 2
MQTLAVLSYTLLLPLSLLATALCALCPLLWPLFVPYVLWMFLFDPVAEDGHGRKRQWVRHLPIWTRMAEFFPVKLIVDSEAHLDPANKSYVFGYHPHGIISFGALTNFATEGTQFSKVFPNLDLHLCTLVSNFKFPFFREVLLNLGLIGVSMKSCRYVDAGVSVATRLSFGI